MARSHQIGAIKELGAADGGKYVRIRIERYGNRNYYIIVDKNMAKKLLEDLQKIFQ